MDALPDPAWGRRVVRGVDFDAAIEMHRAHAEAVVAKRLDRQRLQRRALLRKHLGDLTLRGAVDPRVGPVRLPAIEIGLRLFERLETLALQRRLLRVADARFDLALTVGIPHPTRQPDDAVVRQDITIEGIERRLIDVGREHALFEIVEDDDAGRSTEPTKRALVQFGPDLRARLPDQQPHGFARVAQRQDEEPGAPIFARLRMTDHRPVAVVDLGLVARRGRDDDVIEAMPCTIRLLKTTAGAVDFYDFDEYERFVAAARRIDATAYLVALLGGEAGLRAGEMRAMRTTDADVEKGQLRIERNEWQGHISTTKGNRIRSVPMTARLRAALRAHRHLRGERLLYRADGRPMTESSLRELVERTARRASLRGTGPHILRHTFCSHLAMRGAPPRAIQELAGHQDLGTTQRYMHLSPAAVRSAIQLLEQPAPTGNFGDILETGRDEIGKVNG